MIGNIGMLLDIPVWLGVIFIAVALAGGIVCGYFVDKTVLMKRIGRAKETATKIIEDAYAEAKTSKKEAILSAQEEIHNLKVEADDEIKQRRSEVQKLEDRLNQREDYLNKKEEQLDNKQNALEQSKEQIEAKKAEIEVIKQKEIETQEKINQRLEEVSQMTREEAKKTLIDAFEVDAKKEAATLIRNIEENAKNDADKRARNIITQAIQRCAADQTSEVTVSTVNIPNEDMKGRIIGREGRNIKAIEQATGVDLIIDDTPDVITVSCFDPIRREIARQSLEVLMKDGRIQPGRIEEVVAKVTRDLDESIMKIGDEAVFKLGIGRMNKELIKLIGRLRYRYSYGQNNLEHSIEVATFAGIMASELGLNQNLAKRAGLLHDIGKAVDFEQEGSHVELGAKIAKKYGESPIVINAIESHHGDVPAEGVISVLVAAADALSAARPGARYESMENYIERLEQLEKIATDFDGVEKAFAIQAGREVRVMVQPEKLDDITMVKVAHDIKERIENELTYPGQIKVTLIREVRVQELAQ